MKIVGLTGGIASGKSTVSNILAKFGLPIIDCDKISREILLPNKPAYQKVLEQFGREIANQDGSINRKALASIVFADSQALSQLNHITHPAIIQEIKERLAALELKLCPAAVVDAPLLLEAGLDKLTTEIWVVTADRETKIQRAMLRDNATREQVLLRMENQLDDQERLAHADVVITNNGSIAQLENTIKELLNQRGLL